MDNVKHPNLVRLPSGRILFTYTERDRAAQRLRVWLRVSDDECDTFSPARDITTGLGGTSPTPTTFSGTARGASSCRAT